MNTLTIPRNLIKEGFVVLPRQEYENLLRAKQNNIMAIKHSFKVPKKQEKFYDKLDKELTQAVHEVRHGKVIGPFDNVKDLIKSLYS